MPRRAGLLHGVRAAMPMLRSASNTNQGPPTMNTEARSERIAIEGMIECRNAAGEQWRVLRWTRQVDVATPGAPACWESLGPAVFTLLDASAVIQIGGSALQIVATGMVLNVADRRDMERTDVDEVPRAEAARVDMRGRAEAVA
jgi:hypothetical protein